MLGRVVRGVLQQSDPLRKSQTARRRNILRRFETVRRHLDLRHYDLRLNSKMMKMYMFWTIRLRQLEEGTFCNVSKR